MSLVTKWYDNMCSADYVQWLLALHALSPGDGTKRAGVACLLLHQVTPLPLASIQHLAALWSSWSAEEKASSTATGQVSNPSSFAPAPTVAADEAACASSLLSGAPAVVGSPVAATEPPAVLPATLASTLEMLANCIKQLSEAQEARQPAIKKAKTLVGQAQECWEAGVYFDCCRLCDDNLRKEREAGLAEASSFSIGPFRLSTDSRRSSPRDLSNVFSWDLWCDGWSVFLHMVAGSSRKERTADLVAWMTKLTKFPRGSGADKVKYARAFTFKYAALKFDNWCDLFHSDAALLLEFLSSDPAAAPSSRSKFSSGRTSRKRQSSRAGGSSKKAKTSPLCFSRLKKSAGLCKFSPCRFSHSCVSCSGDHAAVDCKSWDQSKADAFIKNL